MKISEIIKRIEATKDPQEKKELLTTVIISLDEKRKILMDMWHRLDMSGGEDG